MALTTKLGTYPAALLEFGILKHGVPEKEASTYADANHFRNGVETGPE